MNIRNCSEIIRAILTNYKNTKNLFNLTLTLENLFVNVFLSKHIQVTLGTIRYNDDFRFHINIFVQMNDRYFRKERNY